MQRTTLSTVREDNVREGNIGLWADTTARWTDWLRTTVGLRQDYFAGRVASDMPENSGNASATMTSPKAGIVLGPWYRTEFFGNAGYDFSATPFVPSAAAAGSGQGEHGQDDDAEANAAHGTSSPDM